MADLSLSPVEAAPAAPVSRFVGLDRLRGLAVLLMVADHVCLLVGGMDLFRVTAGRVAMPLFFVVAGALVRSPKPRWVFIALLGVGLPVVVPWIDSPNVLLLYVLGGLLIAACTRVGVPSWVLILPALLVNANGWTISPGSSYDIGAAVALMAVGHWCLPLTAGSRLPRFLALPGRYPLTLYVGHLLFLQALLKALDL